LEITGGKEEALLLLQKFQQKLSSDQLSSNRLPEKIAENLQFIFKQFPSHDPRRSALANLIFRDSMPLQEVKKLTGVSKSAMSRRNQLSKEHLFSIVFSKVGYL
jgi:DNA-directed RNA polymerase specialized sigma subunit